MKIQTVAVYTADMYWISAAFILAWLGRSPLHNFLSFIFANQSQLFGGISLS
jgi:hypothetical protein